MAKLVEARRQICISRILTITKWCQPPLLLRHRLQFNDIAAVAAAAAPAPNLLHRFWILSWYVAQRAERISVSI